MTGPRGSDVYMSSLLSSNANGGRNYGGGTVMMVAVPVPAKRSRLSPVQLVLAMGSVASLGYLAWKARR